MKWYGRAARDDTDLEAGHLCEMADDEPADRAGAVDADLHPLPLPGMWAADDRTAFPGGSTGRPLVMRIRQLIPIPASSDAGVTLSRPQDGRGGTRGIAAGG